MNCQKFQDILQDLARQEGLDVATIKEALEHAEGCVACDDLLEQADALTADLRALAERDAGHQAPAALEKNLLAAFVRHHVPARQSLARRVAVVSGMLAIAAMALFAILVSQPVKPASDSAASPATAAASNGGPSGETLQADALSVFEDEDAGGFVPLTETFDASSLDGDAVLRVALSRNDLANFGLSSRDLGSQHDQQILADLVVSSDGIPQAIRLLPR